VTIVLLADPVSANALQVLFLKVRNILLTLMHVLIVALVPMFALQVQLLRVHNLAKIEF
jgi:hypothetical protein